MENVLEINSLNKTYGGKFKAIDDLSLNVKKGEIFGLLGPNGSGKSTTINCILSLLNFDSGSIKIFGKEMTPESYDIKSKIGVVFQDVAVFEELTVYENINYFCGLYIKDKNERKKYVNDAINLVGLAEFKKFYPKQLSGGLLRRLNIACGIAHQPKLIFMDEPTVAVDPQSRNSILEGIRKLNDAGATIIYTSHYMEEVEEICSRIIIMDKGRVIAEGSNEQLKASITLKERIDIEQIELNEQQLSEIKEIANVFAVQYNAHNLQVKFMEGKHNLMNLLDYLSGHEISFGKVYSQLPTLNDVFLEITGKQLRD